MPAVMSVAFSSLGERLKKRSKCRQTIKLKVREMSTSQPYKSVVPLRDFSEGINGLLLQEKCHDTPEVLLLKEENDSTSVKDKALDTNLRINLRINDTNLMAYSKGYQVPPDPDVNIVSMKDELECFEGRIKMPRHTDKIDNQTMHSMQTAITHLESKIVSLTSMQTAIKDLGDKINFLESKMIKKVYKS